MQKIEFIKKFNEKDVKGILNPLVREWFFSRFEKFSETQLYGVKPIHERRNILISAPTGGTKTLTAFLSILNYLVELAIRKELDDRTYAVYCSPLKALSNDVYVNLVKPLEEIKEIAKQKGVKMQAIRVGLRTGDTSASERAKMLRKAPHILVTTPETLAIVLTTKKFSEHLSLVEFLVVDEVHALTNKRGTYLSLTMERLSEASAIEPTRVGLSATISPLEEVAKFLVGVERDCLIADVKLVKKISISLDFPGEEILETESEESQQELYEMLDRIIEKHRTTLIFTNTRNATERIAHHLEKRFPGKYGGVIGTHHSSMSRRKRFEIEERLRKGELKVVVSSTSLELGIDIGSIDFVVLLRSPKGSSRALQRIGRAGHRLHESPRGMFIVLDRDDLVECGVLMKEMVEKKIDKVEFPRNALDVLAQQIYGMAITKVWKAEEMLKLIRRSYCYSELSKEDFLSVVSYLAGDYALEHRSVYAKIWYDAQTGEIGRRGKLARIIYMTNLGTIPSESFVEVVVHSPAEKKGLVVGKIDENFLERMKKGDVFVLGGEKYQFMFARGMKAYVRADISQNPTIPSWVSEMLPLSFDSALEIARFRKLMSELFSSGKEQEEIENFVQNYLYCSKKVARAIYNYFYVQHKYLGIPHENLILVEKFKEEKEFVLVHSLFGRRVNDALARIYGFAAAKARARDVEVGVSDNGFYIAGREISARKIFQSIKAKQVESVLREAIERTDILKRRFRHCAARSLMILRSYKGREKSVGRQQVHSELLFSAVRKISKEFPILREARREVMEDLMDVKHARWVVEQIERGKIKVQVERVPLVSPFGVGLLMQGRFDLIRMEDRTSFLKRMHELHLRAIGGKV
ncbi:ATP-dependent helicase [Candidatus Pacearchaeota archaeon]|nr:MAG: ATP-dependent helicase [Candidatus Pacearchaeota archaeon]